MTRSTVLSAAAARSRRLATTAVRRAHSWRVLAQAGALHPQRPDRLLRAGRALMRWGSTQAGAVAVSAARFPDDTALIDDLGTLRWRDLHERSNALARALGAAGLAPGDAVAILCRNHRGLVDTMLAAGKLGLDTVFLNTMFAGPQLSDVCRRERVACLVYDEEFAPQVSSAPSGVLRFVAWADADPPDPTLEGLAAGFDGADLPPPRRDGRLVILTSGTTGSPKGAQRQQPASVDPVASFVERIPLRARQVTVVAVPLFHSWGLLTFSLGLGLGCTQVVHRRFDPGATLAAVAAHRARGLVVVPLMLQRILALPASTLDRHDTSSLRVIAASGSALPGDLAVRTMDRFGDVLYNLYGSTEVAWASIATPADLRDAPGTAGRPPRGTALRLVDDVGEDVRAGQVGRIFVRNDLLSAGYTDGGSRESLAGLVSTGDVGHLDRAGRLFVDGREDDMIVSGGENVFPREVEDLLAEHPAVADAAVVGVDDPDWGQRLRAVVVPAAGREVTEDALREYVAGRLARFKAPRDVVFVDELPRNATGKVLRDQLP